VSALPWNPAWFQPGESLWSVASKLAFVACSSLAEVLDILGGVVRQLREAWLFPTADHAARICRSLELPWELGQQMFAGHAGLPDLKERAHWQLAIRYCPVCQAAFVHRTIFQDRRVAQCPVHGCALAELCPNCTSPIDPLGIGAWVCNSCEQPFVDPTGSWLEQFRSGTGARVAPAKTPPTNYYIPPLPGGTYVDRRNWAHQAFEEHAVLASVLLGPHLRCAEHEYDAQGCGHSAFFDCPLAAAVLMTANHLGIHAQSNQGGWVPSRPHISHAEALAHLEYILCFSPADRHAELARALTRAWLGEALSAFLAAAQAGHDQAVWRPSPDPRRHSETGRLKPVATDAKLVLLAGQAGLQCVSTSFSSR
jgi:hypothetical protein